MIPITIRALRYTCILFPFTGFMITFNVLFQAMGKALPAAILSLARQGIFFIPIILTMPRLLGLTGVLLINHKIRESAPSSVFVE